MPDTRVILALLSAAVGAILLISSLRRRPGSRPATGRSLLRIYSGLFFTVALVLWLRGPGSPNLPPSHDKTESISRPDSAVTTSPVVQGTQSQPPATPPIVQDTKSIEKTPDDGTQASTGTGTKPGQSAASQVPEGATYTQSQSPSLQIGQIVQDAPERRQTREPGVDWPPENLELPSEDEVYDAVSFAFDWVESVFTKYGWEKSQSMSAVPPMARRDSAPARAAASSGIQFPDIVFYSGTADLTVSSQEALKSLAEQLLRAPQAGILEIQARIDSIGPEAFNHILTQARAAAVRDHLVGEGVPAERLIAVGLGSQNESPAQASSGIEFVMRR